MIQFHGYLSSAESGGPPQISWYVWTGPLWAHRALPGFSAIPSLSSGVTSLPGSFPNPSGSSSGRDWVVNLGLSALWSFPIRALQSLCQNLSTKDGEIHIPLVRLEELDGSPKRILNGRYEVRVFAGDKILHHPAGLQGDQRIQQIHFHLLSFSRQRPVKQGSPSLPWGDKLPATDTIDGEIQSRTKW